jgi:hypothetical protein
VIRPPRATSMPRCCRSVRRSWVPSTSTPCRPGRSWPAGPGKLVIRSPRGPVRRAGARL